MPFRSVKSCSRLFSLSAFGVLAAGLLPAYAAITVRPISGGGMVGTNAYYTTSDIAAGNFVDPVAVTEDYPDYRFGLIDRLAGQYSGTDLGRNSLLRFEFQSDKALTDGQNHVVVVRIYPSTGSAEADDLAPIASRGGSDCSTGNSCRSVSIISDTAYLYAVDYTSKSKMELGLYIADICTVGYDRLGGNAVEGCNGLVGAIRTVDPSGTTLTSVRIQFEIWQRVGNVLTGSAIETVSINLKFQVTPNTVTCNTTGGNTSLFFPGDSQITLYTSKFGLSSTNLAPASRVVVVGQQQPDPVVIDSTFANSGVNDVVQRVGLGSEQTVGGFENATSPTDNLYDLRILIRDASGLIATNSACTITGVQTVDIDAFLEKGECLIATAAFRSHQNDAVRLLRTFRDQVLAKSRWGKKLVSFYYRNSPSAAAWLMEHPTFRLPVLLVLAPLQALAWLMLNPIAFVAVGLIAATLVSAAAWTRLRRTA